jgi:hypothetical protein
LIIEFVNLEEGMRIIHSSIGLIGSEGYKIEDLVLG